VHTRMSSSEISLPSGSGSGPGSGPGPGPASPTTAEVGESTGPTLEVTARGAKVMQGQLIRRGTPNAAIRFGIRGGGCTGYSYVFEFSDSAPRKSDHVFEYDFGVRMYVDPKSMIYLDGTKIDFETGMRGHGFKFDNPNVKNDCGCGESISF